jgi:hypothetical protein
METKTCNTCNETKPLTDFYKDRDTHRSQCKHCYQAARRNKYHSDDTFRQARLEQVNAYIIDRRRSFYLKTLAILKKEGCKDCAEHDPRVLDFDHVQDKTAGISWMIRNNVPWEKIELEIAKCEVRCANCHRRKTAKDRDYWKGIDFDSL